MSAWPEAVYIINEIQSALGLTQRIVNLQNRLYVFAPPAGGATFQPDLSGSYDFSDDSVWFVQKTDDNNQIYAVSVYSEEQGWSSATSLSALAEHVDFTTSSTSEIFTGVNNVKDALDALAAAVEEGGGGSTPIQIIDASTTDKGIVQIGDHINVSEGLISIPEAVAGQGYGVTKLYASLGTNTDGTMTQSAIKNAIENNVPSKSENVLISNWSTATVTLSGSSIPYYVATANLTASYGTHPTISVVETSPYTVPTEAQIQAFNRISFITVNGNALSLYAKIRPTTNFTINVKF